MAEFELRDLRRLQSEHRILFIRQDLRENHHLFGRDLLLRGLRILGSIFSPRSDWLAAQRFHARLFNERDPGRVTPPRDTVLFPIEDLAEQRYVIALAPADKPEEE